MCKCLYIGYVRFSRNLPLFLKQDRVEDKNVESVSVKKGIKKITDEESHQ